MKKQLVALGAAAVFGLSAPALAQDFQAEGGISYVGISPDVGPSDSAIGVDFTLHFDPVRTQGHPLAEAAFLNRASNVFGAYATFDKADLDSILLGGEFYIQDFYLRGEFNRLSGGGASSNDYGLTVGFLPRDGLLLTLGYDKADLADVDTITLGAKSVTKMVGDTALNLEGSLAFVDDGASTKVLALSGDYYFNPMFSAGARFAYTDNDFDSFTAVGVGARYFFTPTFSLEAEYITEDSVDTFGFRGALRF